MKAKILITTFFVILLSALTVAAGDPPHNSASGVSCSDCHGATLLESQSPFWTNNTTDAAYCAICLRCHTLGNVSPYNAINAPPVVTHKEIKCTTCHHNHGQDQIYTGKSNRSNFFLATGTAVSAVYDSGSGTTIITYSTLAATDPGSDWANDLTLLTEKTGSGRGGLLIPDTTSRRRWSLYIIVAIDDPAPNTIKVKGNAVTATNIAIIYGQLIRGQVQYDPVHSTPRSVKLYNQEGAYAFAHNDGQGAGGIDSTPNGNCQVCHESTNHWRNDGSMTENHYSGQNCMRCHPHSGGFLHGGDAGGTGCIECHGHDDGALYDPDMAAPYSAGASASLGAGSYQSHSTHTETDPDDAKGPGIYCDTCHDINNFPYFKTGADGNGDGLIELSETDVCDACHSGGGAYDGLDDPVIGAKEIWPDGAYAATDDSTLQPGKEKWCATCHDDSPSQISGVNAPNVIGDEGGAYTYGTGWGYYKTGHGLVADEQYPSKGGVQTLAGRPVECDSCHDYAAAHIDGEARTFGCGDGCDATEYRQGYRLSLVSGEEPMQVPWPGSGNNDNGVDKYRLCVSCHDSAPYVNSGSTATNMRTGGTNHHEYHLGRGMHIVEYPADYTYGSNNSQINCVICHNVHGSTQLAMIRDGRLINRQPGLQMWYTKTGISVTSSNFDPEPQDIPLALSDGKFWWGSSASNLCSNCHGGSRWGSRSPYQNTAQAPILDWTGETSYTSDGAYPDSAAPGSSFTFRVKYTDTNNEAPASIQLWIDLNDNDNYGDAGEKLDLNGAEAADTWYYDGKLYTRTLNVTGAGGDTINYRFYASDGTSDATGAPTGESSITLSTLTNSPPELAWVSDACRDNGVSPYAAAGGTNFVFYAGYTDADNDAPTLMQVWVDLNDDGDYDDAGEKQDMVVDGGDGDYSNGENFTRSLTINYAGDGKLNYRFAASDGTDNATGEPTGNYTVTVIDTSGTVRTVCTAGHANAPCDSTTIQPAVDASSGGDTVLVYDGTYNEKVSFHHDYNDISVRSVCGPELTTIDAAGVGNGVYHYWSSGSLVDGFQIINGSPGVNATKYGNITIDNCAIHDNPGGGVSGSFDATSQNDAVILKNSEIYNNQGTNGAGFYIRKGGGSSMTNTVIRNNTATGLGGGVCQNDGAGLTIVNSIIADNQAVDGGAFWIYGNLNISNSTIANNTATGTGGAFRMRDGSGGPVIIKNSILWGNATNPIGGGHIGYLNSGTTFTITDSILSNEGGVDYDRYPYFKWKDNGRGTLTISGFVSGDDPLFADAANGDYHIQAISPAIDNGNAVDAPADDIDRDSRPQGAADDIGADEYLAESANNTPALSWTGESGYSADGVNPDSATGTSNFTFRVDYTDADDTGPLLIQVWVDMNDDSAYSADEKYTLTATDAGDSDFTDGKRYSKTLSIPLIGDGIVNYRFYGNDGMLDATGPPIVDSLLTVTNNPPTLSWTGESGYGTDGANPDSAAGGSGFEFRVDYTDIENTAPAAMQVWVDIDDNGSYGEDEKFDMTPVDGGDTVYTDGKRYTKSLPLFYRGDGSIMYRFSGGDGTDTATGPPISDQTVTVTNPATNNIPALDWTGEAGYTSDGVNPDSGAGGTTFTFRVKYTDSDNDAPVSMQIWIDADDSASYEPGEKHDMTEVDGGDTDFTNGKLYTIDKIVPFVADGTVSYRFYARDSYAVATGTPIDTGGTVHVVDVLEVPGEYGTIQAAIDASSVGDFVQVADGSYSENINYNGKDITVQSVNGAALTSIHGAGVDSPAVTFAGGETSAAVLDGFTIDNNGPGDKYNVHGVKITNSSAPTIRNSTITGNNMRGKGTGILIDGGAATIENSTIDSNTSSYNNGAGLYLVNGSATTTITDSSISNNTSKSNGGGGLYVENSTIELDNVNIDNNMSSESVGGGARFTGNVIATITGSSISNNSSKYSGSGIYFDGGGAGSLTISDSAIDNNNNWNSGSYGGGLHLANIGTTTTINNTSVSSNTAGNGYGGGIYANNAPLNLAGCTIDGNQCYGDGGGIWTNSSMTITGSTISNNRSTHTPEDGGGIYANGASIVLNITNTNVTGNTSNNGGGIAAYVQELNFTGGSISSNTSAGQYSGGGLRCSGDVTIYGAYIQGNSCGHSGAGVYLLSGSLTITNSMITGNQAGTYTNARGGGIRSDSSSTAIVNCTVTANFATDHGGISGGGGTVTNSIVWNNFIAGGRTALNISNATVSYSDTSGVGYTDGGNNISVDPVFVTPSSAYPSTAGDFHLSSGTPASLIDGGTSSGAPADDIDGDVRTGNPDMGSDEYVAP